MLRLREQAEALLAQLATVPGLNLVNMLEGVDIDETRRPGVLPMAQLLLSADPTSFMNGRLSAKVFWSVLITAKTMAGANGLMALVDAVLDALGGFRPITGSRSLLPEKIEFVDRGEQASAYVVTFSAVQDAKNFT
jgi:hypothetical protein